MERVVDDLVDKLASFAQKATADAGRSVAPVGLERLEAAVAQRRARVAPRLMLAAALVGAIVAVLAVGSFAMHSRPLTFEVSGASTSDIGYISCPEDHSATVRFSDHSELGMQERTRIRISHLEVHGADVMVESGSVHARITPSAQTQWTLEAGPYRVHVTGTEFDMAWGAEEQSLDVRMQKGSVIVTGPLAEAGVRLTAGQELVAHGGELSILDERTAAAQPADSSGLPAASAPEPDKQASAPPVEGVIGAGGASAPSAARAPAHLSWRKMLAQGDSASILDEAERRGMSKVLAEASASDLATLADAARYSHRPDVARRALVSLRSRFASTVEARDAAFFLGGLAEGQDDGAAINWYNVYLRESANGSYAPQALGRKMLLVQKSQGAQAARPVANEILSRFPGGPYESAAHKVLDAP
jgi:hypothetical protein